MTQRDVNDLRVSDDTHPLYLSSRPGYLDFAGSDRESCRRFAREMRSNRIGLAVVLLTAPEIRVFYDFDLCELYRAGGVEPLHFPVEDGLVPEDIGSFHRLVKRVTQQLRVSKVLVHCNAGLGRTGVVAAGLLVYAGSSASAAIAKVRKVRRGALENRVQEGFIAEYERLTASR